MFSINRKRSPIPNEEKNSLFLSLKNIYNTFFQPQHFCRTISWKMTWEYCRLVIFWQLVGFGRLNRTIEKKTQ